MSSCFAIKFVHLANRSRARMWRYLTEKGNSSSLLQVPLRLAFGEGALELIGSNEFADQLEEMGSRSSLSRDVDGDDHWDMNFHEAAIYLEVRLLKTNQIK